MQIKLEAKKSIPIAHLMALEDESAIYSDRTSGRAINAIKNSESIVAKKRGRIDGQSMQMSEELFASPEKGKFRFHRDR